jgi:hypothetical protein
MSDCMAWAREWACLPCSNGTVMPACTFLILYMSHTSVWPVAFKATPPMKETCRGRPAGQARPPTSPCIRAPLPHAASVAMLITKCRLCSSIRNPLLLLLQLVPCPLLLLLLLLRHLSRICTHLSHIAPAPCCT